MSQTRIFEVVGTSCASCEFLIEKELAKLPGVTSVQASHSSARVTVHLEEGAGLSLNKANLALKEHGYTLRKVKETNPSSPPQNTWSWKRVGGAFVIVFALYLILDKTGFLSYSGSAQGPTSLFAVFAVGIVAAFSSCTAVVGGLVTAVSTAVAERHPERSRAERFTPHIFFNLGRLVGFVVFGAVIGLIGSSLSLSPTLNAVFVIAIALFMLGLGINLLDIFPKNRFSIRPPKFLAKRIHALSESSHPAVPFVLGALTFFLPCGFTQSMQLYALSTGDPLTAALTMFVFALGTMPALLGIGALTSATKGKTLQRITKAAGALVIVLGISNFQNGAALLGWNLSLNTQKTYAISEVPLIANGEQIIQMEVTPYGIYQPDTLTVVEGVPVRWQIYGANQMGCADSLYLRAFNIRSYLKPGMNEIVFTPNQTGNFIFSCSMGMTRGTLVVLPRT